MQRGPTRKPLPPPRKPDTKRLKIGAAMATIVVAVVVVLWPSRYGKVTNLDSNGSAVIAFGDSLTAGYGAGETEAFPAVLAQRIGVDVINAGVSGDTTESALARLDADVLEANPRIVIVGLGGNDYLRRMPISTTERNLREIVRRIQGAGAMVVLLGFEFPTLGPRYDAMYEKVADEEGCLLIPDLLDGILTNSKLKSDEIHPNAAGYALMAERMAEPCGELIEKANAARY